MTDNDELPVPAKSPWRPSLRLVYTILQVLGCLFMAAAGFTISLTVGLTVMGVMLLALGVAMERGPNAR